MSKKVYYKDGNPELHNRGFSELTWKNLTDREKAMWSPYSDIEQAPVPAEVLEFEQKQDEEKKKLEDEVADLKAKLEQAEKSHDDLGEPAKEQPTEEQQKKILIEELRKKGIKANMNYKLETLQKKLQDATD